MQQNATFCLPGQVYTKDRASYEQLFLAFYLFRYCLGVHLLLCCWKKQTFIDAEIESSPVIYIEGLIHSMAIGREVFRLVIMQ